MTASLYVYFRNVLGKKIAGSTFIVGQIPRGRMKPPNKNTSRRVRAPPVFAIIIVLHTAAISLNIPEAIC